VRWRTQRLGDIFEIARGGSPRPIEKFLTKDPDGINWIKIGDATASGKYIELTKEKIKPEGVTKSRSVYPGDFLLTNSMSFGRPYIMATEGCIHDGWLGLKPRNASSVDHNYFYHLLGSNEIYNKLSARAAGSTVKNLNMEIVSHIDIMVPPLDEQRRIAAILDKADALRRKRKRTFDLIESARNSFIESSFEFNSGGNVGTLGECLEFITTGGRNWSKYYSEVGSRFIRSLDVQMNGISNDEVVYVSAPENAEARRTRTMQGDVLLTVTGSRIGRVAELPEQLVGSYVSQHVAILRLNHAKLRSKFLSFFLSSRQGQRQIQKWQYGQTKPGLNFRQIEAFTIPQISIDLQARLEKAIARFESEKNKKELHHVGLRNLFSSLQHRAFTGQL